MPFNLLLLPLLGGYLFILWVPTLRFYHQEHHGYRLLLGSAGIGVVSMMLSSVTCEWLVAYPFGRSLEIFVNRHWRFDFVGTAIGSLLLPPSVALLVFLTRLDTPKAAKDRRYLRKEGDKYIPRDASGASIIYHAAVTYSRVLVTLESRKVYVAFVLGSPDLSGIDYISLLPIWSGYRLPEELRVQFTTRYDRAYLEHLRREEDAFLVERFTVVIPARRIMSIQRFEPDLYDKAFAETASENLLQDEDAEA